MQKTWMIILVALGIELFVPVTTQAQDDHGDTLATATPWSPTSGTIEATLDSKSDVDFFRLTSPGVGLLTALATGPAERRVLFRTGVRFRVYDGNGHLLGTSRETFVAYNSLTIEVTSGTYYVAFSSYTSSGYPNLKPTGRYELQIGYSSVGNDDHSNIPIVSAATPVRLNSRVTGTLGDEDDGDRLETDFFRVDVVQPGTLTIYSTGQFVGGDPHPQTKIEGRVMEGWGRNKVITDDIGSYDGRNFYIQSEVDPGTYLFFIRGHSFYGVNPSGFVAHGTFFYHYTLHVEFSAKDAQTPDEPDEPSIVRGDRCATLLNLSPWQAWVHLYCQKDRPASDADPVAPCRVTFECNGMQGEPVAWTVDVASKTIFSYWPDKTAPDGTSANLEAVLIDAGKTREEARRRTTCEVFSLDPIAVRGYTRFGSDVLVPVAVYD